MSNNLIENKDNIRTSDMPFIKLFRTPRGYYFYDVNKDMICPVEESTYYELDDILSGNSSDESETIIELKSNGWLSSHKPSKIEHGFTENVELWLDHQVFQLVLQITQACNLSCIYCPYANSHNDALSRSHTSKTMTFETAKKAIDFLAEHSDNSKELFISFYGGEPLIVFPLIKKCVEYADEVFEGRNIKYSITTNATLLTDEMIEYMYSKKFFITFSLDGPKRIHDMHRLRTDGTPTYDDVIKVLEKTAEIYGEADLGAISINMVINPENPLDELLEWLSTPILQKIEVRSTLIENDYIERKFYSTGEYTEKFNYQYAMGMLDYLQIVKDISVSSVIEPQIQSIISEYSKFQCDNISLPDVTSPSGPCLSGVRKLFVNADGKFYPCEKVNELAECMVIGNVDDGFYVQKVKEHLNISQLSSDLCKNCWVQAHCSICQRQAEDGDNLSASKKNSFCGKTKDEFMSTLYACALISECKSVYPAIKGKGGCK